MSYLKKAKRFWFDGRHFNQGIRNKKIDFMEIICLDIEKEVKSVSTILSRIVG